MLDVIPATCSKCNKSIELGYVERQVESFDKTQLEAMMKSTEKIGLFCCNCLNEKNRTVEPFAWICGSSTPISTQLDINQWGQWYECNFLPTQTETYTRRAPINQQTDVWTARDLHCYFEGSEITGILDCYINEKIDNSVREGETIRIEKSIEIDAISTPQIMDLCGKTITCYINDRNEGRFRIEQVATVGQLEDIIKTKLVGRKIREETT